MSTINNLKEFAYTGARDYVNIAFVGMVSAGKSTIMNFMFAETFSEMKRDRTTHCTHIYTEEDVPFCDTKIYKFFDVSKKVRMMDQNAKLRRDGKKIEETNKDDQYLYVEPAKAQRVCKADSCSVSLPEYVHIVNRIEGFEFDDNSTALNIVDVVGFGDSVKFEKKDTNDDAMTWFKHNCKYLDGIVFVADAEQPFIRSEELQLFQDLVTLMPASTRILVVVNKFDNMYDEELQQLFNSAEQKVREISHKYKPSAHVKVVKLSAKYGLALRLFKKHMCLDHLEKDMIIDLCTNLLGKTWRKNVSDPSNITQLEKNNLSRQLNDQIKEDFEEILKESNSAEFIKEFSNTFLFHLNDMVENRRVRLLTESAEISIPWWQYGAQIFSNGATKKMKLIWGKFVKDSAQKEIDKSLLSNDVSNVLKEYLGNQECRSNIEKAGLLSYVISKGRYTLKEKLKLLVKPDTHFDCLLELYGKEVGRKEMAYIIENAMPISNWESLHMKWPNAQKYTMDLLEDPSLDYDFKQRTDNLLLAYVLQNAKLTASNLTIARYYSAQSLLTDKLHFSIFTEYIPIAKMWLEAQPCPKPEDALVHYLNSFSETIEDPTIEMLAKLSLKQANKHQKGLGKDNIEKLKRAVSAYVGM